MAFYISWLDRKSNAEFNSQYASLYYELLLKGCRHSPAFLEKLRGSSNLQW